MNEAEAQQVVTELSTTDGWKDPLRVATTAWRSGALATLADDAPNHAGVILVELALNHPHQHFYGIARVDDRGIWYSDGDGHVNDPAWRLRLMPWRHIDGLTMHQTS